MNERQNRPQIDNQGRTEPALGDLGSLPELAPAERRRRGSLPGIESAARRRRWPWLLVIGLAIVLAAGWTWREDLREWLPQTRLNSLLDQADAALVAGRLDGQDGTSARELYAAARTLRPDGLRAQEGLSRVGQAALAEASVHLQAGETESAEDSLRLARALLGGGEELERLEAELARARARGEELDRVLERAAQALEDGNIDGRNGAGALYRQALVADPGNAIARHGLDKVAAAIAAQVRTSLRGGDLAGAERGIARLQELQPGAASLPQLQAALGEAREQAAAETARLLTAADADLAAGRLAGSGAENALARYRAVLQQDADNERASLGVAAVGAALLQRAAQRAGAGDAEGAERLVAEAAGILGETPEVAAARQVLADTGPAPGAAPAPDAEARARVAQLVARGSAAAESGRLMLPPGESAWDLFRAALSIDPDNGDAMAGLAALPGQARQTFDEALARRDLAAAREMLETYEQLAPGSAVIGEMRSRLDGTP